MREITSTKDKILDRTLYLIGKKGSSDISVRDIAAEAEVNVSAINYHFQSKEHMFKQMEAFFVSNFISVYKVLDDDALDTRAKILNWCNEVMEYTLRYPGILVLMKEKMENKDKTEMGKYLLEASKEEYRKFNEIFMAYLGTEDERVQKYSKMILTSSIVFPSTNFANVAAIDESTIETKENRLAYLDYLLSMIEMKAHQFVEMEKA